MPRTSESHDEVGDVESRPRPIGAEQNDIVVCLIHDVTVDPRQPVEIEHVGVRAVPTGHTGFQVLLQNHQ